MVSSCILPLIHYINLRFRVNDEICLDGRQILLGDSSRLLQFSSATPGRPIGDRAEMERFAVPKGRVLSLDFASNLAISQAALSVALRDHPVDASRLLADG